MKDTWVTADTHFGHDNIRKFCNRPYKTAYEMDEGLIHNWNCVVKTEDTVYHVGDFSFRGGHPKDYLDRLNGKIILIWGNHDKREHYKGLRIETYETVFLKPFNAWLSHYPHWAWPSSFHGSIHLFGHVHGKGKAVGRSMDVGVDPTGYAPLNMEEVVQKLTKIPIPSDQT